MKVPFVNLGLQYQSLKEQILEKFDEISERGEYVLSSELREFEENFAKYCGTRFAAGVGNGGDALFFSLIALVGFVNIISALAMIIIDKTRQIGLLKSLGLSKGKLYQVFLIKGLIIGAAGSLGGSLLAVLLALLQNNFKLITVPEDVYFMDFIPIDVNAPDILLISVLASLASVFAALWPTFRSGQIQPADALKYE